MPVFCQKCVLCSVSYVLCAGKVVGNPKYKYSKRPLQLRQEWNRVLGTKYKSTVNNKNSETIKAESELLARELLSKKSLNYMYKLRFNLSILQTNISRVGNKIQK